MKVVKVIIFCLIQNIVASRIYDCSNGTVYLSHNQIAFYETPNFPKKLTSAEIQSCNLTFILDDEITNTSKIFTSFLQLQYLPPYLFKTMNSSVFHLKDMLLMYYYPIKGNLIFEENDENCPLESISKKAPYRLLNENEVIYLYSNHYQNRIRKDSCLWRFSAPIGYGFKIVIQAFDISFQTSFRIKNSTDLLINENSVKINYPIYNYDTYLEVSLSNGNPNFIVDYEFEAYLSIIKMEQEKKKINCTIFQENSLITWTNIDKGYEANTQCTHDFIIQKNTVMLVDVVTSKIEGNVDYISYNIDGDDENTILGQYDTFVLEPYKNGSDKHVFWKFESDGSVNLIGFEINFQQFYCQCLNRNVKCSSRYVDLMNVTYADDYNYYYCGNLKCNFTIEPCQSKMTAIQIKFGYFRETNNIFRVISNNQTLLDISRQQQSSFTVLLHSINFNIFQVITFPSEMFSTMTFSISPVLEPTVVEKIVLSRDKTTVIIDSDVNVITPVEIDKSLMKENIFFILYCTKPASISLYTDASLNKTLKNCFTENSPRECIIKEKSFVIYQVYNTFLAITLSIGSKNCVFQKNIFMRSSNLLVFPVSVISNENGACLLTLLNDGHHDYISHIWTTSKKDNIKIFAGSNQEKLVFEFNSRTIEKWKKIMLMTPIHTILLPKSEVLFFTLTTYDYEYLIPQYPYQSLVTTEGYGLSSNASTNLDIILVRYRIMENSVKFTVIDYTFTKKHNAYFKTDEEKIYIKKTGDIFIFQNQDVDLYYVMGSSDSFLFVETLEFK